MHGNVLAVSNLYVDYQSPNGKTTVLENLSFSLPSGHILGVAGESGSGKTTIALALMRLISRQKADIKGCAHFKSDENNSLDLLSAPDSEMEAIRGRKISMVFQEPRSAFNPLLTCGNQIAETIRRHLGVSKSESVLLTKEWLAKTDLSEPERIFHSFPHQLSGGQLQRTMIAMALCCRPSLLMADEPLASSDYSNHQSLLKLFRKLKEEIGLSIIFISHDFSAIEQIADSVLVLNRGRLVEQGQVKEIIHSPKNYYTLQLVESRIDRKESIKESATERAEQMDKLPVLTVKHLKKIFKERNAISGEVLNSKVAVQDLTFELFQGETLGVTGNSGSGKTTLARCLCGLLEIDEGEIKFKHKNFFTDTKKSFSSMAKGKVQIIFQNPDISLNPKQTIGEAIMEPLKYFGSHGGISEQKKYVLKFMEKAGLESCLFDRFPHQLSGGQKQRAVILRALVMQPEVLICDEPVAALDAVIQLQILKQLNDLKQTFGFAMIFISHDWPVVKYMSDRIMLMEKGTLKHISKPEILLELLNSEQAVH